jgi:arylformamidase
MPLVDLSRPLVTGLPVYPGDPPVAFSDALLEPPWKVTALRLGSHSGTHIDAAAHFVPGGSTIDAYALERFVLECAVIHVQASAEQAITWHDIAAALPAKPAGRGLLLHTGWDAHFGREQAMRHPFLTDDAAQRLVAAGIGLVGTDAFNIDASQGDSATSVHAILLGADVLIVENLTNLAALSGGVLYQCAFVPLKLAGCDGSPIRAYAWV